MCTPCNFVAALFREHLLCLSVCLSPFLPLIHLLSLFLYLPLSLPPSFPTSLHPFLLRAMLRCVAPVRLHYALARARARAYKEKGREGLGEEVFDEGYFSTTHTRLCVAKSESHQIVQLDDAFVVLLSRAQFAGKHGARAREREWRNLS